MNRRKHIATIGSLLVVLLAGAGMGIVVDRTWLARDTPAIQRGGPGDVRLDRRIEHVRRRLGLTDEQTEAVRAILIEARDRSEAVQTEIQPRLLSIRADMQEKLRAVLTHDQLSRYGRMLDRFDRLHPGRRGRGPARGRSGRRDRPRR